jgi:hypothetical protein
MLTVVTKCVSNLHAANTSVAKSSGQAIGIGSSTSRPRSVHMLTVKGARCAAALHQQPRYAPGCLLVQHAHQCGSPVPCPSWGTRPLQQKHHHQHHARTVQAAAQQTSPTQPVDDTESSSLENFLVWLVRNGEGDGTSQLQTCLPIVCYCCQGCTVPMQMTQWTAHMAAARAALPPPHLAQPSGHPPAWAQLHSFTAAACLPPPWSWVVVHMPGHSYDMTDMT